MAVENLKGKVTYADATNGYGYIVAEGAQDPSEAYLFTADDVAADQFEVLVPGQDVTFKADPTAAEANASEVATATTA